MIIERFVVDHSGFLRLQITLSLVDYDNIERSTTMINGWCGKSLLGDILQINQNAHYQADELTIACPHHVL